MRLFIKFFQVAGFLLAGAATLSAAPSAQVFTLQVGPTVSPPTPLVQRGDNWRFFKGTNDVLANWQSVPDASLPDSWGEAPGGFGYGDPGIVGEATTLSDMLGRYTTFYIRRTFMINNPVDPALFLQLQLDYDDGFVAYLDGVELTRANTTQAAGVEVPVNGTTGGNSHEASCCSSPNPPSNLSLGAVGNRLAPGAHVLAIQGINQTPTSSDFHLIADLSLSGGAVNAGISGFFTLVHSNAVQLSGSNTLAGSTRVVVDGIEANYSLAQRTWSATRPLSVGLNRVYIAALDSNGSVLASTNHNIIYETGRTLAGGTLTSSTTWSGPDIIQVTNDVQIPTGLTLTIDPGVIVLLNPGLSIIAQAGGTVDVQGTEAGPVFFLPADGHSNWGAVRSIGVGATYAIRHSEFAAGAVECRSLATGLIEDSYLHDRGSIITGDHVTLVTLRRIHVRNYDEVIFNSSSIVLAEDSLFERTLTPSSDAFEIQGGPPGSIVRRCTFRYAVGSNSDAVDFNGSSGVLVDSCLIHDYTDKGISLGAAGAGGAADFDIRITNCLIYAVAIGVAVKDSSTATLDQTTISDAQTGLSIVQKFAPQGGGHIQSGRNNIIWGDTTSIITTDGGTVDMEFSDIEQGWPGTGNLMVDPLFVNAPARDFHLQSGSPVLTAGFGGTTMGVIFPVGGIAPPPFDLSATANGTNEMHLSWREDADNEDGFLIQRSTNGVQWLNLAGVGRNQTNFTDASAVQNQAYLYRVQTTNTSGHSPFSNLAGATRQIPVVVVAGTLTADTTWTPAMGTIVVSSNVVVPAGITLTITAGTSVYLTNTSSLLASAGGTIHLVGTREEPIRLLPGNPPAVWGEIAAEGTGASLTLQHVEVSGGAVKWRNGASGLMEDCYVHNYKSGTIPIAGCTSASALTVRRCHFSVYHETLWQSTPIIVEDSLFENANNPSSDALDFDAAPPGAIIRRCTFRHGPESNTDAIDLGSGSIGTVVEDCLMFDFPNDKGVSIGESSFGIVIRNCLVYGCDSGVAVKDGCTANIFNCTFVDNDFGFRNYNKANPASPTGGGFITNAADNILWGNDTTISLLNSSTAIADHSDLSNTNWPGIGNIDADPLFVNPAQRDYRLRPGSPCIGTGRNGGTMGVHFPVGAPMALSHPRFEQFHRNGGTVQFQFWVDSEKSYQLQSSASVDGGWVTEATFTPTALPRLVDHQLNAPAGPQQFYRLVTP